MDKKDYEMIHQDMVREMAPECMVLLKSDGAFPLEKPGKIALYGNGARRTLKGGGGSGNVNVKYVPNIEDGLEKAGFEITTKAWMDAYEEARKAGRMKFREWLKKKLKRKVWIL